MSPSEPDAEQGDDLIVVLHEQLEVGVDLPLERFFVAGRAS